MPVLKDFLWNFTFQDSLSCIALRALFFGQVCRLKHPCTFFLFTKRKKCLACFLLHTAATSLFKMMHASTSKLSAFHARHSASARLQSQTQQKPKFLQTHAKKEFWPRLASEPQLAKDFRHPKLSASLFSPLESKTRRLEERKVMDIQKRKATLLAMRKSMLQQLEARDYKFAVFGCGDQGDWHANKRLVRVCEVSFVLCIEPIF